MHDSSISTTRLFATVAWITVACFMVAAWTTWLAGTDHVWALLGLTGCACSAIAAVAHIHCYAMRLAHLVRVANGLGAEPRPPRRFGLRSVTDGRSAEL